MDNSSFGVIALNNIEMIDRKFSSNGNTYADYVNRAKLTAIGLPFTTGSQVARAAAVEDIAALGSDNCNANDLVNMFSFSLTGSGSYLGRESIELLGIWIEIKMLNFRQGYPFPCNVLHSRGVTSAGIVGNLTRNILVTPLGGANSTSEGVILPTFANVQVGVQSQVNYGIIPLPLYDSVSTGQKGFLEPACLLLNANDANTLSAGSFNMIALVWRGVALQLSTNVTITCTPLFNSIEGAGTLANLLTSLTR